MCEAAASDTGGFLFSKIHLSLDQHIRMEKESGKIYCGHTYIQFQQ